MTIPPEPTRKHKTRRPHWKLHVLRRKGRVTCLRESDKQANVIHELKSRTSLILITKGNKLYKIHVRLMLVIFQGKIYSGETIHLSDMYMRQQC